MTTKKAVKKKTVRTGVCAAGYDLIRQGKNNRQVLAALRKRFPASKIKIGGVGWLRARLIEKGEKVKPNAEL